MSYFLGTNSNSISMLFSGMSGNAGNLTGNMISDYYSIRNGSYKKLLTSYYNKLNAADDKTNSNKTSASTNISIDSNAKLSQISSVSSKLQESSTNLLAKGSTSLFKTSEVKDENGNVTSTTTVVNETFTGGDAASAGTYSVTIENRKGFTLPKTGDIGTAMFLIIGIGGMLAAVYIMLRGRKRA